MAERGHRYEDVMAAINARRPDFNAYIEPQKEFANVVIQVLPTLIKEDKERGTAGTHAPAGECGLEPTYLMKGQHSLDALWAQAHLLLPRYANVLRPRCLLRSLRLRPRSGWSVDKLEEVSYIETHLSNTSKYPGEMTHLLLQHREYPGSNNGTCSRCLRV